jgi:hypothetical protein
LFDPLTSRWLTVRLWRRRDLDPCAWDDDCDCGRNAGTQHHELCSVTPTYADLARTTSSPREIVNVMYMEWIEFTFPPREFA